MAHVIPFRQRDGTARFTCSECGGDVLSFFAPTTALCLVCDFAQRYPAARRVIDLRGEKFRREAISE